MKMSQKKQTPGLVKQVISLSNPIVKQFRSLQLRKNRVQTGLFVAEGLKLVTDAVETNWPIHTIIYANSVKTQNLVASTAAKVKALGGQVLEVTPQILEKISRKKNPQMVLGIFHEHVKSLPNLSENIHKQDVWIALDRIRDPGNLGTIIRTADAVGAAGIILIGDSTDPFSLEAVRASMGSIFHIPVSKTTEEDFLQWIQTFRGKIIGTHLAAKTDYRNLQYKSPTLILMGNEQQGLSENLSQCCNQLVRIPMTGTVDSLNLAVSTGIMLFEVQRDKLSLP